MGDVFGGAPKPQKPKPIPKPAPPVTADDSAVSAQRAYWLSMQRRRAGRSQANLTGGATGAPGKPTLGA